MISAQAVKEHAATAGHIQTSQELIDEITANQNLNFYNEDG